MKIHKGFDGSAVAKAAAAEKVFDAASKESALIGPTMLGSAVGGAAVAFQLGLKHMVSSEPGIDIALVNATNVLGVTSAGFVVGGKMSQWIARALPARFTSEISRKELDPFFRAVVAAEKDPLSTSVLGHLAARYAEALSAKRKRTEAESDVATELQWVANYARKTVAEPAHSQGATVADAVHRLMEIDKPRGVEEFTSAYEQIEPSLRESLRGEFFAVAFRGTRAQLLTDPLQAGKLFELLAPDAVVADRLEVLRGQVQWVGSSKSQGGSTITLDEAEHLAARVEHFPTGERPFAQAVLRRGLFSGLELKHAADEATYAVLYRAAFSPASNGHARVTQVLDLFAHLQRQKGGLTEGGARMVLGEVGRLEAGHEQKVAKTMLIARLKDAAKTATAGGMSAMFSGLEPHPA